MKYIDSTFSSPAENLAFDEALLDWCDEEDCGELLWFYEATSPFVVLGYANRAASEVELEACKADGVPIYRRCSGGGTVVQGPGCLSYSLILKIAPHGPFESIAQTNAYIMQRHQTAIAAALKQPVRIEGHSDLAIGDLKFSGNAQRRKRHYLLFHGTFLLNFDIPLISRYLRMPSKQPDYRNTRKHSDFLMNLGLSSDETRQIIRNAWRAEVREVDLPLANLPDLVQKYSSDDWRWKF